MLGRDSVRRAAAALESELVVRERALQAVPLTRRRDQLSKIRSSAYAPEVLARYTKRVVLYEDCLELAGERLPLMPGLQAEADMQGVVNTVQGWVFKSDHDRRRLYLKVTAPGFAKTLDFPVRMGEGQGAGIGSSSATFSEMLRGFSITDPVGDLVRLAHLATERAKASAWATSDRLARIVPAELVWQGARVGELATLRERRGELAALLTDKQFVTTKDLAANQLVQRADRLLADELTDDRVGEPGSLLRAAAAARGAIAAAELCARLDQLGIDPEVVP